MRLKKSTALPWAVSTFLHGMLLLIALPPAGGGAAGGMEILGVDVLNMSQAAARATPSESADAAHTKETPAVPNRERPEKAIAKETQPSVALPPAPPAPEAPNPKPSATPAAGPAGAGKGDGAGTGTGDGQGVSYGAGDGYVLERPVYYPKNAQNEGVGGRVQLAIFLGSSGTVKAEVLQSSGDERLDRYALRAVAEAWKYRSTQTPLRIRVSLVFSNGNVQVVFEGAEPVKEEASQP